MNRFTPFASREITGGIFGSRRRASRPFFSVTSVPAPCLCVSLLCFFLLAGAGAAQGPDYLTSIEADKIRDADLPHVRIKLFVEFAADRLTKFKYELSRGRADRQRNLRLQSLLDGYMGCMDDAAELLEIGRMRQQDIHKGIEELEKRGAEFLAEIEGIYKSTPDDAAYKADLQDAITSTKESLAEAQRAKEEIAPPPVRRKP